MAALTARDTNVPPPSNPASTKKQSVEGVENVPQSSSHNVHSNPKLNVDDGKQSAAYISPSDAILSPASQKLSTFKQRQINKQQNGKIPTSRLLFTKSPSSCSGGYDDVEESER
ncbi:hypothetical protein BAUCODRAFT_33083 [Baudoinia panamericana UAMH 10762]|uniref:Uncharacterized protein n=1 Tax=Baudoinia panamericana (strain UAMH 10762) TaxID=717646 RepID=M2NDR7_BAUPA|nr:uncharacterized protein BAUCODRAFT_33083 [Baudoinia panamericana UAMH 10762]EMC97364.1 hypothetical protein BAUCODRAFT_33083 [Baudoinia panamericana UAMH 10762]